VKNLVKHEENLRSYQHVKWFSFSCFQTLFFVIIRLIVSRKTIAFNICGSSFYTLNPYYCEGPPSPQEKQDFTVLITFSCDFPSRKANIFHGYHLSICFPFAVFIWFC